MKIKEILSNCIGAVIVIVVGFYVLTFNFKFKYKNINDWMLKRNPIIYFKGERLN